MSSSTKSGRPRVVGVRLSADELAEVRAAADLVGMSVSGFMRNSALAALARLHASGKASPAKQ